MRDSPEQIFCFGNDEDQSPSEYLSLSSQMSFPSSSAVPDGMGRAPYSTSLQEELPNGVLTRFTKCYSPFCGMEGTSGSGSCYSLYCPNGPNPVIPLTQPIVAWADTICRQLGLQRKLSSVSLSPTTEEPPGPEAWASTASPELIEQLGSTEVARQVCN